MNLSDDQQKAADDIFNFLEDPNEGEMVLAGHSGTGKSFLTKYIIQTIRARADLNKLIGVTDEGAPKVYFTATTNKAAEVLSDAVGELARTIHSFLGLSLRFDWNTGEEILQRTRNTRIEQNALIIIDEASMISKKLLKLIRECTQNCKILFIGDPYQLPPVKAKYSPVFHAPKNITKLEKIMRQAEGNGIIELGDKLRHTVKTGEFFPIEPDGNHIIKVDWDEFGSLISEEFTKRNTHVNHARLVAWKNKTVIGYNNDIRSLHTDSTHLVVDETVMTNKPIMNVNRQIIYPTDAVTRIVTVGEPTEKFGIAGRYYSLPLCQVFQPDDIEFANKLKKKAYREKDWIVYNDLKDMVGDLRTTYSLTTHKSQGSTYDRVYIDLEDIGKCNKPDEVARLLYVAITRAKEQVILYGNLPPKYC